MAVIGVLWGTVGMSDGTRTSKTRYEEETGAKLPRWRQQLSEYMGKPGYFLHFSQIPKFGLNPHQKGEYQTPLGLYAYAAEWDNFPFNQFGLERPYVFVFRADGLSILDLKGYTKANYVKDMKKLGVARKDALDYLGDKGDDNPGKALWDYLAESSSGIVEWTHDLSATLGYDGVIDKCQGIIDAEPCQAVFFKPSRLTLVDVLQKEEGLQPERVNQVFNGKDLSGQTFKEQDLTHAVFFGAKMVGTILEKCKLEGANFKKANLTNARFLHPKFGNADFAGATLVGTTFLSMKGSGTNFKACNLSGAMFDNSADCQELDFRGANLMGATIKRVLFQRPNFEGANLSGARLEDNHMETCTLHVAILHRATLEKCYFTNHSYLTGADFGDAKIEDCSFPGAILHDVNFANAAIKDTNFVGSMLNGSDLSGATLTNVDLRTVELRGVNLVGCDLSGARLDKTVFEGCKWDKTTKWPKGFKRPAQVKTSKTRYERETGKRLPNWRELFAMYEGKPGYYVHFAKFPKLGLNPVNGSTTPLGFYAYPADYRRISDFAVERPYMVIFRADRCNLLHLKHYMDKELVRDLVLLGEAEDRATAMMKSKNLSPGAYLWWYLRTTSLSTTEWTQRLFRILGYDGVVDDCQGIVWSTERCQAMFFNTPKLDIVDLIEKGVTEEDPKVLQPPPKTT